MTKRKYIFVGNRRFVLEAMLEKKLDMAAVLVIANTHLERDFLSGCFVDIPYNTVNSKQELLLLLHEVEFDILVSNGCPYILPLDQLPKRTYVNIHPSLLPDLRGVDPVIGSILFSRDAGATCHSMDSGIDTGDIISQVHISCTPDLDVTTLYQLTFHAEKQAFEEALEKDFVVQCAQTAMGDILYYTRKAEDMQLFAKDSNAVMLRKIKAFNNKSIGCHFFAEELEYKVFSAMRMENTYLADLVFSFPENTVALSYEDSILFHRGGEVLRFMGIVPMSGRPLARRQRLFGA